MRSSLEITEKQSSEVAKTPNRISLDTLNESIAAIEYINPSVSPTTTIAVVKLVNGYVVFGSSTPADPANYNQALGQQLALDNAKREIWPLLGYGLRQMLWEVQVNNAA